MPSLHQEIWDTSVGVAFKGLKAPIFDLDTAYFFPFSLGAVRGNDKARCGLYKSLPDVVKLHRLDRDTWIEPSGKDFSKSDESTHNHRKVNFNSGSIPLNKRLRLRNPPQTS